MINKQSYKVSVVGILRDKSDKILMVKQQTKNDPYPIWTIPGGRVEKGENIQEALYREFKEETGIFIKDCGKIVSVVESDTPSEDYKRVAVVFEIGEYSGDIEVSDPDKSVLKAMFLSVDEIVEKMKDNPYKVLREHLIDYLNGKLGKGSYINFSRNEK